jgi:spore coat protein U-like protein
MRPGPLASLRLFCGAVAVLLGAVHAEAATCSVSTTPVAFGTYDVFSVAPNDTTGSVSLTCNGAHNIVITLSTGSSSSFNPRTMTKPSSETLNYNLYLDAARTSVWGDGNSSTSTYTNANPPNNIALSVTIYGRIPAGQDVTAGAYADSVTVTINF